VREAAESTRGVEGSGHAAGAAQSVGRARGARRATSARAAPGAAGAERGQPLPGGAGWQTLYLDEHLVSPVPPPSADRPARPRAGQGAACGARLTRRRAGRG
jgi:hypothetical protein